MCPLLCFVHFDCTSTSICSPMKIASFFLTLSVLSHTETHFSCTSYLLSSWLHVAYQVSAPVKIPTPIIPKNIDNKHDIDSFADLITKIPDHAYHISRFHFVVSSSLLYISTQFAVRFNAFPRVFPQFWHIPFRIHFTCTSKASNRSYWTPMPRCYTGLIGLKP